MQELMKPSSYTFLETVTVTASCECHDAFQKSSYLFSSALILSKTQNYRRNTFPGVTVCMLYPSCKASSNVLSGSNCLNQFSIQPPQLSLDKNIKLKNLSCNMNGSKLRLSLKHKYLSRCSHSGSSFCSKCRLLSR